MMIQTDDVKLGELEAKLVCAKKALKDYTEKSSACSLIEIQMKRALVRDIKAIKQAIVEHSFMLYTENKGE